MRVGEEGRAALADALAASVDRILARLADEASRASTLDPDPDRAIAAGYQEWMRAFVPGALEALRARGEERVTILRRWSATEPPSHVDPIPPVARRGLFSLGIRLAREEAGAYARARGLDEAALVREMDDFAAAMASALTGSGVP